VSEKDQNRLSRFMDHVRRHGEIAISSGFEFKGMAFSFDAQRVTSDGVEPLSIDIAFAYPDDDEDES
jgi:hypothetical protein